MNDDLYLIALAVMVLIPTIGTLLGMHRDEQFHRLIRESIDRIGTCPACHHPEHPMFCMVVVADHMTCGCDLMTDPGD
jgi:hypothetical protein